MLTGDIKKHVDLHISKIAGYDQLRSTVMNWAVDRNVERDRKGDPMDNGAVRESSGWNEKESWSWETDPNSGCPESGQERSENETVT